MIQPQLYGISWARLLFGRVYVSTDSLLFRVWDYIFESLPSPITNRSSTISIATNNYSATTSSTSTSTLLPSTTTTTTVTTTTTTTSSIAPSTAITESIQTETNFQPKSVVIEDRLNKHISYNIQDPLLLKLACFILGLVLEVVIFHLILFSHYFFLDLFSL